MAKIVTLTNGRSWSTQKAAIEHFKLMLARYEDDEVVNDFKDHDDLLALLVRYDMFEPSEQSKIGSGIERFERRLNRGEGFSTSGFWAVRPDGAETDFSYITAVKGKPKPVAQQYYDACRNSVSGALSARKQYEFDRFGDQEGCLLCDISGARVAYEDAQLRHADPVFILLVQEFRMKCGWQWDKMDLYLTVPQDSQISTMFRDRKNTEAFRAFHKKRAVLHIVSKEALNGRRMGSELHVKRPIRLK